MATVWRPTRNAWWIWAIPIVTFLAAGIGIILLALEVQSGAGSGFLGLSRRNELLLTGVFFLVFPALYSVMLFLSLKRRTVNADRIETGGIPALARILSVEETGTTINNLPQCRFRLLVTTGDGTSHEFETRSCVSLVHLQNIFPGRSFRAKIDPDDGKSIVIDFGAPVDGSDG